ncbi:hypothetical protein LTR91_026008, partial [Friedmanniomyces endolithicus]
MGAQKHYCTQSSYHLFGLPPELRILIYEYALISEKAINVDDSSNSSRCSLTALLETCQAIRKEASPIFYKLNTFLAIIRQQHEGIPQNVSILPTFRTSKTARVGRLVILLVYDDGSNEPSDLHLRAINHTILNYRPDAYGSLPSLREAVQRRHDWSGMETAFKDAKTDFAEYNKWDEYGMILLLKDVEMALDERLVENNGTTTTWLGDQQGPLEKALSPRMLRLWKGQLLPYMFCLQRREAAPMRETSPLSARQHLVWGVSVWS